MTNQGDLNGIAKQFLPMFTGQVKPVRRKNASVPKWEKHTIIGESGDLFTKVRMWVYEPTLEYPEISIFLQLKNAGGSAFTKLTLCDIEKLASELRDWVTGISEIYPYLENKRAEVHAYQDQYNKYSELADYLREQAKTEQQPDYDSEHESSDDDFPPDTQQPLPKAGGRRKRS